MLFLHVIFAMRKLIPILENMLQFIPAFPLSALNIFSNTFRLEVLLSLLSLIISLSLPTKYTRHVRWCIFYIPEAAPYQLLSLAFVVFLNQIKSFPPSLKNQDFLTSLLHSPPRLFYTSDLALHSIFSICTILYILKIFLPI